MLLIDREKELEWLEKLYKSNKAELVIVYGRRRAGKTYLIKNFIKDKQHFYFLSKQKNIEDEFKRLKEKFAKKFNIFLEARNFERFFEEIFEKIEIENKLIFVIDEFPYWIQKNPEIVSEFQYLWDEILKEKPVMLILIGSYVSVIEDKLLSYSSPLYGRRTSQIKIKEMPITSLKEFFPNFSIQSLIEIYGLVDTIPYYMNMIETQDIRRNLLTLLNPNHNYYQDAEILLREEVREVATYLDILKAINDGYTKLNEIANASRVDITNISKYLRTLLGMKIIEKIKPITASEKEKRFIYRISDNYFRFWLKFVYNFKEEIEENIDEHVDWILKNYSHYMGGIFEKFCTKFMKSIYSGFRIGKWWHKDKEIDIVALNEQTKQILFCECKWQSRVNARKLCKDLAEKAQYVQWHNEQRKESFAIFAKNFSKRITEFKGSKVYCFDLKDLEKHFKK